VLPQGSGSLRPLRDSTSSSRLGEQLKSGALFPPYKHSGLTLLFNQPRKTPLISQATPTSRISLLLSPGIKLRLFWPLCMVRHLRATDAPDSDSDCLAPAQVFSPTPCSPFLPFSYDALRIIALCLTGVELCRIARTSATAIHAFSRTGRLWAAGLIRRPLPFFNERPYKRLSLN
jgi:hypothetical protein